MATFVSGFVVGFTAVWQLALVTLAVVPLIAVIGAIHQITLSKLSAKTQEALSQAGNIAEQVRKWDCFNNLSDVLWCVNVLISNETADSWSNSDGFRICR